ncbi:MAG: hypothetical protein K0R22_129 [Sporomusa sp.]|jgi:hypothetical protein|nr:hypothetical protein [Sporomusa sp.]
MKSNKEILIRINKVLLLVLEFSLYIEKYGHFGGRS